MDAGRAQTHRLTNTLQSLVLLGGMGVLLLLLGYTLAGAIGAWLAAGVGLLTLILSPRIAPSVIMRLYGGRPIEWGELPEVQKALTTLSERAGLSTPPTLYYVPTRMMNAFTVGQPTKAAIGVTDGLLRAMSFRELTGVLAHEVSHLMNNDLRVMTLADVVSRMTASLSHLGQILLFINLPMYILGGASIPWIGVLLLLAAPLASTLLQLALSRQREFDADLGAYALTGDARGLASALAKMERYQHRLIDMLALPGRRVPDPSMLRTHPNSDERVRRLLELEGMEVGERPPAEGGVRLPSSLGPIDRPPRWHVMGLWY